MAVNCRVMPTPVASGLGVIAIDRNVAGMTFRLTEPEMEPDLAVMVVEPTAIAEAKPDVGTTVAMAGALEVHAALFVRSVVLPSLKDPVATNCCVSPTARLAATGVTVIDFRTIGVLPLPPQPVVNAEMKNESRKVSSEERVTARPLAQ